MEQKISNDFLSNALNKWGDKWWFKICFVALVTYFVAAPILTTIINNEFQKEHMSEAVSTTLDDRDADASARHKNNFEISRQAYALAKTKMVEYLSLTGSEYIFLLEFHNGSENVVTGIQFCRFDMTLEVVADSVEYVQLEKFRDDIIARYDILLSEDLAKNKVIYCRADQFKKSDRYLTQQMAYVDANAYAIVSLKDKDNKIFGAILCITNDGNEDIDLLAVRTLGIELEDIFTPTALRENNSKPTDK